MRRIKFILLFLISGYAICYAQEPKVYIDSFFDTMKNESIDVALDNISKTNKFFAESKEQIDGIKEKFGGISHIIGKYQGAELFFSDKIGSSLVLYSYLVKFERQPLCFTFIFYKPDKTWGLHNFQFDTNIVDMLSEKSKVYSDKKK